MTSPQDSDDRALCLGVEGGVLGGLGRREAGRLDGDLALALALASRLGSRRCQLKIATL